jgi:hypothetical protein
VERAGGITFLFNLRSPDPQNITIINDVIPLCTCTIQHTCHVSIYKLNLIRDNYKNLSLKICLLLKNA